MDDAQIHSRIEELVAEEHGLWDTQAAGSATDADRQRRALEEFSMDPDVARARTDETVEGYEQ